MSELKECVESQKAQNDEMDTRCVSGKRIILSLIVMNKSYA